jgi:phage-related protein
MGLRPGDLIVLLPPCAARSQFNRGTSPVDNPYIVWYNMEQVERKLDAVFFKTDSGNEPVREWLLLLAKDERKIVGDDVLKVQYCWPIGKPLVGNLGDGLWEVRSRLGDRIARLIFCVEGRVMVLLHGFIKKTRKTPKHELDLAMKRKSQLI